MRRLKYSLAVIPIILINFCFIFSQAALAADPPEIKSIFPKKVSVGDEDLRVRIRGKKFTKDSVVLINNAAAPEDQMRRRGNNLFVFVPANLLAQPGAVSFSVRNADGSMSKTLTLSVIPASDVVITGIRPRVVVAGVVQQAFGVIAQGANFDGKAVVRVGGKKTDTAVQRKGEFSIILGTVDPAEVDFVGSVPVQIENGDGKLSNTFNILISAVGPRLDSIDPTGVDIGSAQTTITLAGEFFKDTSKVFVNGRLVPSRLKDGKKNKDKTLLADVPADLLTQITRLTVQVVNEGTGDSQTLLLDVRPPKTAIVYSLNPSRIVAGSKDFDLVISGENLRNTKMVLINGSKNDFKEVSQGILTLKIKAKAVASPGELNLQVVTKDSTSNAMKLTVEPAPIVSTIAGDVPGFKDGVGTFALMANPGLATVAPDGMIYFADQINHAIRRLNPATNEVKTIAGDPQGRLGYVDTADIDDDNPTLRFSNPIGIVSDPNGVLYISDFGNDVIRRMRFGPNQEVTVDTVAGRSRVVKDNGKKERFGLMGFIDDVPEKSMFNGPYGIALDEGGNILVADSFNNVIRKITLQRGDPLMVSTVFGNGFPGLADGAGIGVQFSSPTGLFKQGSALFVNDFANNAIRRIDMATSQVSVLLGVRRDTQSSAFQNLDRNSPTFSDGDRFFAVLSGPISATFDDAGNLYYIDFVRSRIRRLDPNGAVTTIAGSDAGFKDGSGLKAAFRDPRYILFLGNKTLLLVDSGNHRIRTIFLQ